MTATDASARHRSRRRLPMLLAGLAVVGLIGAAFVAIVAPYRYDPAVLRTQMARQVREATGLVATRDGHARFRLFPQPHVDIEDVAFADPTGGIRLEAAALSATPRFLSLLAGRLELASVTLREPELTVDLDSKALAPDSVIGRAATTKSATPEAVAADAAHLGVVVLEDGRARLKSRAAADATIDGINATLDWRDPGSPISLTGRAHVHHQPTDLALWVGAPSELLRGGSSAVRVLLHSTTLALSSSGALSTMGGFSYRGRLSATGASLHDVVALLGYDVRQRPAADDFSVRGDVDFVDERLTLANLKLHLFDNDFEGAVAIETRSQRKAVSGTLAADTLRLAPFMPATYALVDARGAWSETAFQRRILDLTDLDLRVSAARAVIDQSEIGNVALSLLTRRGGLEIGLADATLYGGHIRGRLDVQGDDEGVACRLATTVTDIDLADAPWAAAADRRLSGRATGTLALEGAGRDMAEIIDHLAGRGELSVAQGAFPGVDVEQALRRTEKHLPVATSSGGSASRTAFGVAKLSWHVAAGVAELDQATFSGPGSHITAGGRFDLRKQAFDVSAEALQAGTDGLPSETGPRIRYALTGPFGDPTLAQTDARPTPADAPN